MFPGMGINNIEDCINLRFDNIKRSGTDIVITACTLKNKNIKTINGSEKV
jgi:hypothetical protein